MTIYEVTARRRVRFWLQADSLQQARDAVRECKRIEGYADEEGRWDTEVYPVGLERVPRELPRFGVLDGHLEPLRMVVEILHERSSRTGEQEKREEPDAA